jgi:hypothetical protein
MSSISPLVLAQQYITRYGMTTYLILGNIGLLCNIIIFSQHAHRRKSISLYILATSLCSFIGLNVAVIPIIYALNHSNSFTTYLIYCRVQFYFRHATNQMMRTFIVLICADCYAACSNRARIRAFSQYRIAIYIIPFVVLFWLIVSIFPTMLYSITEGVCDYTTNDFDTIMYSIYITIVLGILPLVGMITFELLIIINLKQMRARVQPIRVNDLSLHVLRKRDRDMIKMLSIESSVYICTSIPLTFAIIYRTITYTQIKSDERKQIETFILFFTRVFLLYINNSLLFWIYISTSKSFRIESKNLILKWYAFITLK